MNDPKLHETQVHVSVDVVTMHNIVNRSATRTLEGETFEEAYERICRDGLGLEGEVPYRHVQAKEVYPWVFRFQGFGVTLEASNPKMERNWISISGTIGLGFWDFGFYYGIDSDGGIASFTVVSPHIIISERPDYRG